MQKLIIMIMMVVFTFFNLSGYSLAQPATSSEVKKMITEYFKINDGYLAERIDLVNVTDINIGPMRTEEESYYDRFLNKQIITKKHIQSYEATIKVNCVGRMSNKIEATGQEKISGEISRDKMGKLQPGGIVHSFCEQYQYGCAAGDCTNGVGIFVVSLEEKEGGPKYNYVYMARFINGESVYGFIQRCGGFSGNCYSKPAFQTKFRVMPNYKDSITNKVALKEFYDAKILDKEEYDAFINYIEKEEAARAKLKAERNAPPAPKPGSSKYKEWLKEREIKNGHQN